MPDDGNAKETLLNAGALIALHGAAGVEIVDVQAVDCDVILIDARARTAPLSSLQAAS